MNKYILLGKPRFLTGNFKIISHKNCWEVTDDPLYGFKFIGNKQSYTKKAFVKHCISYCKNYNTKLKLKNEKGTRILSRYFGIVYGSKRTSALRK